MADTSPLHLDYNTIAGDVERISRREIAEEAESPNLDLGISATWSRDVEQSQIRVQMTSTTPSPAELPYNHSGLVTMKSVITVRV